LSFEGSHCFLERFDSWHDDMLEGFLSLNQRPVKTCRGRCL
jgi:hypothetical protein